MVSAYSDLSARPLGDFFFKSFLYVILAAEQRGLKAI